ncbi:hypothetical protein PORY_000649 [Pneumocystis oryctolagi]|uniref:Uncharacterized protein n=1 Tax=Pneumocystis oryctolagi TaxID=42067 RepID=A0ACB7CDB2_9ASCO|nr:hypothetical protein PORY_000649 [Pneumocystis oryctolagi]
MIRLLNEIYTCISIMDINKKIGPWNNISLESQDSYNLTEKFILKMIEEKKLDAIITDDGSQKIVKFTNISYDKKIQKEALEEEMKNISILMTKLTNINHLYNIHKVYLDSRINFLSRKTFSDNNIDTKEEHFDFLKFLHLVRYRFPRYKMSAAVLPTPISEPNIQVEHYHLKDNPDKPSEKIWVPVVKLSQPFLWRNAYNTTEPSKKFDLERGPESKFSSETGSKCSKESRHTYFLFPPEVRNTQKASSTENAFSLNPNSGRTTANFSFPRRSGLRPLATPIQNEDLKSDSSSLSPFTEAIRRPFTIPQYEVPHLSPDKYLTSSSTISLSFPLKELYYTHYVILFIGLIFPPLWVLYGFHCLDLYLPYTPFTMEQDVKRYKFVASILGVIVGILSFIGVIVGYFWTFIGLEYVVLILMIYFL